MTVAVDRPNYHGVLDVGVPTINYRTAQDPGEAHDTIRQAVNAGDRSRHIYALGYLALLAAERDQVAAAEHPLARAEGVGTHLASGEHLVTAMVSLARATVLDMLGEAAAAADAAHLAVVLARKGTGIRELDNVLPKAMIPQDLSDHDTTEADRKEAGTLSRGHADGFAKSAHLAAGHSARDTIARNQGRAVTKNLTSREREILGLLATRLSRREIGQRLYVSLNTVKTHQRAVYRKLGVENRSAAVSRAQKLALL